MNAIETRGLTKQFGAYKAVNELNLSVPAGSICGFLGRNGAGKTTTIKMLVGLAKPTSGSISLMGTKRKFGYCDNSNIGYLPDVPNFYGYMTAAEYLDFCGRLYNTDNKKRRSRVDELLKQVDLFGTKTRIAGFSRGMKQRLGIAQALMNEPDVIFLDEPVSALDPIGRHELINIVRSLRGSVTVFLSTHILSDVENVCDYALIIEKGKLLVEDTVENIKKQHATDTANIKLYSAADSGKFTTLMQTQPKLTVEELEPSEFLVRGMELHELNKQILPALAQADIAIESYHAHVPSLEDIFLEVTKHA
ncbi:MAG: ABC transporter ATP-binding protein [Oscillospiraceae bacterium]|nr:ABC transporter ATP-binding protein [Oscillospiraceae bacterium]